MRKTSFIVFIFIAFTSKAQYNLVPNPSFENYTSCSVSGGGLSNAIGWVNPVSSGTPDYYNACTVMGSSVPYCANGTGFDCFQYAKTGFGYTGIYGFGLGTSNVREYAQIQLSSPLTNGKCYYVGYYANLINWCGMGINNLGLYLSNNLISQSTPYLLNYTAQVKNNNNSVIVDTLNWNLIAGIYQAVNSEKYITLGNFNNDASTDTIRFNPMAMQPAYSYFLIDDVFVIPIDSIIGGMPANAGVDKSIAIGDSTFIGQEISNLNCNWYQLPGNTQIATNTSGIYVKPNTTTTYVVEQNLCGTITYDTVKVYASPTALKDYEALQNSVTIYPNPSDGNVSLQFKYVLKGNVDLIISDITGKIVYQNKLQVANSLTNFDIDVKSGIYFVKIYDSNINKTLIKKLVVQQ